MYLRHKEVFKLPEDLEKQYRKDVSDLKTKYLQLVQERGEKPAVVSIQIFEDSEFKGFA